MVCPKSDTPGKIIEVAARVFAERGYDASSLTDIATEVGIRTPSLYSHYANKRALYEAVIDQSLAPCLTCWHLLACYRRAKRGRWNC